MSPRVLIAEDDDMIADVVARYLEREDFDVARVTHGRAVLAEAARHHPDLVILDVRLPGLDGRQICARLRAHSQVPVIMLSALAEDYDRIAGLEAGADDYVTKPFNPQELVLRVRSLLRRTTPPAPALPALLRDGDLLLDTAARSAGRGGHPLALTGREWALLAFFLSHPGVVVTRQQLLAEVWRWSFGDASTITVHIRRLREKIEDDPAQPRRLVTVWGVGYRFDPSAPASP